MIRNKAEEILTIIPYLIKKWVIIVVQLYHQLNLFPQGLNKHLSACNKFSPSAHTLVLTLLNSLIP